MSVVKELIIHHASEVTSLPEVGIENIIDKIHGHQIEVRLIDIASIGGEPLHLTPEQIEFYQQDRRFSVNRLALSDEDKKVRDVYLKDYMTESGMTTISHPLGLLGTYEGSDPTLAPVLILSHTDSVPKGDMYDGVLGVVGGIAVVNAVHNSGQRPKRSIQVLSLTGEESSRFGTALFGSMGLFHGLDESTLKSRKGNDLSIEEALSADIEKAKIPLFGPNGHDQPTPFAAIELHVDQTGLLEKHVIDLAVVERVAAPQRHRVKIKAGADQGGQALLYPYSSYLKLQVDGKADHSGATKMGKEYRSDGLLRTSELLLPMLVDQENESVGGRVSIVSIHVEDGAMNKVPGITTTYLKIEGNSEDAMINMQDDFDALLKFIDRTQPDEIPFSLLKLTDMDNVSDSLRTPALQKQHRVALEFIKKVNEKATARGDDEVVGTVGVYSITPAGDIELDLDVRGIDLLPRDALIEDLLSVAKNLSSITPVEFGDVLSGCGDPVTLDPSLVLIAASVIERYQIATYEKAFSAAGHDIQNVARAGIPSVMIFCQSHDGIAHSPNAYTAPENMEKGIKALAALTLRLASE